MPTPILHQTDLFGPHMDPDDHWDLACQFALAAAGETTLDGVLIDYPPDDTREPDILAIAQLCHISGLSVPWAVGSSQPVNNRHDVLKDASAPERNGVRFVLNALRNASAPLAIHVVGSCRDIAIALRTDPALFASKCRAVYLNAGSGDRTPDVVTEIEYNVKLNASAYATLFDAPCTLMWMPCRQEPYDGNVHEWATYWRFRQSDILPALTPELKRYFAFMLSRNTGHEWLRSLKHQATEALLAPYENQDRAMWCTAGFLHAAGKGVLRDGTIVDRTVRPDEQVFSFEPITVTCDDKGQTAWSPDASSKQRFIFHVRDVARYQGALTSAMRSLLMPLGRS
jgi:hypothetical protein